MKVFIRTDASTRIGTGHIMRMLALAQDWRKKGGEVHFYSCECPDGLVERLKAEGFAFHQLDAKPGTRADFDQFLAFCREETPFVVLDGYHFDISYQSSIRKAAKRLLVVDDYAHLERYDCDILLNQNPGAEKLGLDKKAPGAKLLLGLKYALLRREFLLKDRQLKQPSSEPLRLLVTMGGSDAYNVTGKVLDALSRHTHKIGHIKVLAGAANPHLQSLRSQLQALPIPADLLVNSSDVPEHMAWADAAITAGGSTCWELAYFGVPMAVITLADNQQYLIQSMKENGLVCALGWAHELTNDSLSSKLVAFLEDDILRINLGRKISQLVDGRGTVRVVSALRAMDILLKKADTADSEKVWLLANDPEVRKNSFLTDTIHWESHQVWFAQKLCDPSAHILMAYDRERNFIGVVRFEGSGTISRISVAIDAASRGKGLGAPLLIAGMDWLFSHTHTESVEAFIRPENSASITAFKTAGFDFAAETVAHGAKALKFILNKDITFSHSPAT